MPATNKLTDTAVRKAAPKAKPHRLADGEGMYLEVMANGSKYWRLKYRFGGKEKRLALGVYPRVTLADARQKRADAKRMLDQGEDPSIQKQLAKITKQQAAENTFASIAEELIQKRIREGAAPVTIDKMRWIVERKLGQQLGRVPIAELRPAQLLAVLQRIDSEGLHETANRAKRVAGQVMRFAVATGRAERDITQDLAGALTTPTVTHRAAITEPSELGKLLVAMDDYQGTPTVKAALQLTPMLFQRPGEIRHMEWAEINWDDAVWDIPANKMKMGYAHLVPLSWQSVAILRQLQPLTGSGKYVFPSMRRGGRPLSENGVRTALRTLGYANDQVTSHGFRATARTLLDELLGYRVDWIEQQLAHAVRDANGRAYNRTKYLPQRKQMMQAWADYLDKLKLEATN